MEQPNLDESKGNTILKQVHEGMRVCNNTGEEIGSVREVFLGAVSENMNELGRGPATASTPEMRDETLVDNLAEAFADYDSLPETVRERLLRHGFIRIDTHGLFASDRYALPDQIESVSDDCVRLRATVDELIKHSV